MQQAPLHQPRLMRQSDEALGRGTVPPPDGYGHANGDSQVTALIGCPCKSVARGQQLGASWMRCQSSNAKAFLKREKDRL